MCNFYIPISSPWRKYSCLVAKQGGFQMAQMAGALKDSRCTRLPQVRARGYQQRHQKGPQGSTRNHPGSQGQRGSQATSWRICDRSSAVADWYYIRSRVNEETSNILRKLYGCCVASGMDSRRYVAMRLPFEVDTIISKPHASSLRAWSELQGTSKIGTWCFLLRRERKSG